MAYLTDKTYERIAEAISEAETESGCELLAVFAARSDDYFYIPMLWAAALSLFVPYALFPLFPFHADSLWNLALTQWFIFALLSLLLRTELLRPRLVPKRVRTKRAEAQARLQFTARGFNSSDSPPAVLFFVSLEERYAQILTNAKVPIPDTEWQRIIDAMVARIRAGEMDEGMVEAVRSIGKTMEAHCPVQRNEQRNSYPNRLVVL